MTFSNRRLTECTFVALDVEATGIAYGHDRIIELGVAQFTLGPDGVVRPGPTYQTLVNPKQPIPVPIERLTGLSNADVADAPTIATVWPDLLNAIGTGDAGPPIVLAHSVRSDLAYLVSEAARHDLAMPEAEYACTLVASRHVVTDAPRHTLQALIDHLELGADKAHHRALADALHTRNLFGRCAALSGAKTLGALGFRTSEPVPHPSEFEVHIPPRLLGLQDAIIGQRQVEVIYAGGSKGRARRLMTPMAFYAQLGEPYLRAWCHIDDAAKSFRCDRIKRFRAVDSDT